MNIVIRVAVLLVAAVATFAQTRSQQALAVLNSALAATAARGVDDITLSGQATLIAGSETDSGEAKLQAKGYDLSRVTLLPTSGAREEIRNVRRGSWSKPGAQGEMALHNTWTSAAWFAPSLVVREWVSNPLMTLEFVGPEQLDGVQVTRIRARLAVEGGDAQSVAAATDLSAMDLLVGAKDGLPMALEFNVHPDNDYLIGLPTRITVGDYRNTGGAMSPFRIQRFLQNTLTLDFAVSAAQINTGISSSEFAVQ